MLWNFSGKGIGRGRLHRDLSATALLLLVAIHATPSHACDPAYATTGPAFCFVSEVGGCGNLPAFLAAHQPSFPVTLVVDQQCGPYSDTLTLPGRMTLAGVGRDGAGELLFANLDATEPALAIANGQGHVQIRDLLVRNIGAVETGRGLYLNGNHQITLDRVRIDRFNRGVEATLAFSVLIGGSNISNNRTNLLLGQETNTWRVRDTILSRAIGWSVIVRGPNNDVVFDGNRLESNQLGAIRVYSLGAVLSNNRFEFNGAAAGNLGIDVRPSAQHTRILNNIFSSDIFVDAGPGTRCAFNINVPEPLSCL